MWFLWLSAALVIGWFIIAVIFLVAVMRWKEPKLEWKDDTEKVVSIYTNLKETAEDEQGHSYR